MILPTVRARMELTSLLCIMHEIDLKMSNVFFYARVSSVWSVFFTCFVLLLDCWWMKEYQYNNLKRFECREGLI